VPSDRLANFLRQQGQEWIEDPSNADPAYFRVRVRQAASVLDNLGLTPVRLAETASRLRRERTDLETMTAAAMADAVTVVPAGYAMIDRSVLASLPSSLGWRLVLRCLRTIGGGAYAPRAERLNALLDWMAEAPTTKAGARTLAGCRIVRRGQDFLICRESAAMAPQIQLRPGTVIGWDGRFEVSVARALPAGLGLGGLGMRGWAEIVGAKPDLRNSPLPSAVRSVLPAVVDARGVVAVPHLGYGRDQKALATIRSVRVMFRPMEPLAEANFGVANPSRRLMC